MTLTSPPQPDGRRLSEFPDATIVDTFIRLGEIVDGHVSGRHHPNDGTILKEISRELGGAGLCSTGQSDVRSLRHRVGGTQQDGRFV